MEAEIAAIAARRTVQATAGALLKAIEKRVPIARFVAAPILDGVGQLTEEFVRWWSVSSNSPEPSEPTITFGDQDQNH